MKTLLAIIILLSSLLSFGSLAESGPILDKKELTITKDNFLPPFNNYEYLQGSSLFPFEYETDQFSLVNAWWFSELATLTYSAPVDTDPILRSAGFTHIHFISKKSTQLYIMSNEEFVIVSFRGTEADTKENPNFKQVILDWQTNLSAILVKNKHGKGKVHQGFQKKLDIVWNQIINHLEEINVNDKKLWITGHSLGGALATLAASRYANEHGKVNGVYTFGSPRVGNIDFKNAFNVDHYRFVNNKDVVCEIPANFNKLFEDEYAQNGIADFESYNDANWFERLIYIHVGHLKFFDGVGTLHNTLNKTKNDDSNLKDLVYDHTPTLYAVRVWNSLIDSLMLQ